LIKENIEDCFWQTLFSLEGEPMALNRKVGFFEGLRYKGGGPMLAWILHRISGVGMVIFVSLHVAASFFTQQMGSDWGISLNIIYESVYFQLFIYFCVIYHGLNGLRIIVLDLWPKLIGYQREATWLQWLIFIPVYGLTIFLMIRRAITGG
jgi:succinate dehydrogenase / fumarate reductase cytochrome b subunit